MQFGRFSWSNNVVCISVPFCNAKRKASGLRSSEAFISRTEYPACRAIVCANVVLPKPEIDKKLLQQPFNEFDAYMLTWWPTQNSNLLYWAPI